MNFFKVLFSKQEGSKLGQKKRAVAFVDFEHWYISLDKLYHIRPDIKGFRDELSDRYDIVDIAFFGDFSNPSLRAEIFNIRQVSNTIIETQNSSAVFEKDFTDFIMLDHIYQSAIKPENKDIDAYILFTGDGHFSSAARKWASMPCATPVPHSLSVAPPIADFFPKKRTRPPRPTTGMNG